MQYDLPVLTGSHDLAARLLREAQRRRDLTPSSWATKAGVSRALLHNYLRGRHQPSLPQLDRLLRAAGQELQVDIRPLTSPRREPGERSAGRPSRAEQGRALLDALSVVDAIPVRRQGPLRYPLLRDMAAR